MRYLIFAGKQFYPDGGALDFRGSGDGPLDTLVADTLRAIKKYEHGECRYDWWNIFDTSTGRIVAAGTTEMVGGCVNERKPLLAPDCVFYDQVYDDHSGKHTWVRK